jgi:hypothetical protein
MIAYQSKSATILTLALLFLPIVTLAEELVEPRTPNEADTRAEARAEAREANRRDAIEKELDHNQATVQQLYAYLDDLAANDSESRTLLESQIEQYDDRSSILFDELEALDRARYINERKRDYKLRVQRLTDEAGQLRRAGRPLAAAAREAQAREIQKSLEDGTWKLDAADEWGCDADDAPQAELGKLRRDIALLRKESEILQQEVQRLSALVQQLAKSSAGQKLP